MSERGSWGWSTPPGARRAGGSEPRGRWSWGPQLAGSSGSSMWLTSLCRSPEVIWASRPSCRAGLAGWSRMRPCPSAPGVPPPRGREYTPRSGLPTGRLRLLCGEWKRGQKWERGAQPEGGHAGAWPALCLAYPSLPAPSSEDTRGQRASLGNGSWGLSAGKGWGKEEQTESHSWRACPAHAENRIFS